MRYCFALILFLFAATAYSQVSLSQGAKVNGLGLGSTRAEVVGKLGKPVSETKRKADECVGGTEMTLRYPGLRFVLWDDPDNPKKFSVGQFEVTSVKWDVSGTKVGQASAAVRKVFGTRSAEEKQSGLPVWFYYMDENISPGSTNFHFRNGKIIKIVSLWQMC
jgi:hypothetical protein